MLIIPKKFSKNKNITTILILHNIPQDNTYTCLVLKFTVSLQQHYLHNL